MADRAPKLNMEMSNLNIRRRVRFNLLESNRTKRTQNVVNLNDDKQDVELYKISLVKLQEKQYPLLVYNYDLKADEEEEESDTEDESSTGDRSRTEVGPTLEVPNYEMGCHGIAEVTHVDDKVNNSTCQPTKRVSDKTDIAIKKDEELKSKFGSLELNDNLSESKAKLENAKKLFFNQSFEESIKPSNSKQEDNKSQINVNNKIDHPHQAALQIEIIDLDLDVNLFAEKGNLSPPVDHRKRHGKVDRAALLNIDQQSSDVSGNNNTADAHNWTQPPPPPVLPIETDNTEVQVTNLTTKVTVTQQPHRDITKVDRQSHSQHSITLSRGITERQPQNFLHEMEADLDLTPLASSSTEATRTPSEHEQRFSRSLKKLELPDWFKKSSLSRHGSRERLLGLSKKPGQPRWSDVKQRSTSMSSLPVISRSSTPSSTPYRKLTTPSWRHHTPTSPSVTSTSPFSRQTSNHDTSGQYFQYPSLPPASSSRCTSPFCSLGGFNYTRPYTGWRSSERLAQEYAVDNEDDISSYDHSYVMSSTFYWSPEERLSRGPGYHAMKFGIHPGIFSQMSKRRLDSSNFEEQLSSMMSTNHYQSSDGQAPSAQGNSSETKVTSFVNEIDRLMFDNRTSEFRPEMASSRPEIVAVKPKAARSHQDQLTSVNGRSYEEGLRGTHDTLEMASEDSLADDIGSFSRHNQFITIPGGKSGQSWSSEIGESAFSTHFYKDSKEAQTEWNSDVMIDDHKDETGQQYRWDNVQRYTRPLSSSSPIPGGTTDNEFQPIIYDLSMVDSKTAFALGLPVPATKSNGRFNRTSHPTPSTPQHVQHNASSNLPLSSMFTASTTSPLRHAKVTSSDILDSSLSESAANYGDDDDTGNSSSDESDEESVSLPKFSSKLPKMATTTVTHSNGRIAQIVEIPTSSSNQSSVSLQLDNLQPLKVTPSNQSLYGTNASPNRPLVTPITSTTFITKFQRDSTDSDSQPEVKSLSGTTRTLTLLNEDILAASPPLQKKGSFKYHKGFSEFRPAAELSKEHTSRTTDIYSSKNETVTSANERVTASQTASQAQIILSESKSGLAKDFDKVQKETEVGSSSGRIELIPVLQETGQYQSISNESKSASLKDLDKNQKQVKVENYSNINESVTPLKGDVVLSASSELQKPLNNQQEVIEGRSLTTDNLTVENSSSEKVYKSSNEAELTASQSFQNNKDFNEFHLTAIEGLRFADDQSRLVDQSQYNVKLSNEEVLSASPALKKSLKTRLTMRENNSEASVGLNENKRKEKDHLATSETVTHLSENITASSPSLDRSIKTHRELTSDRSVGLNDNQREDHTKKDHLPTSETVIHLSENITASSPSLDRSVKTHGQSMSDQSDATESLITEQSFIKEEVNSGETGYAYQSTDILAASAIMQDVLETPKQKSGNRSVAVDNVSVNQSIDSWTTAQSRDYSVDMSVGTIVHRIGYVPRGNVTNTSYDDTTSVFSGVTDFDTSSVVRMRTNFDDQRKQNRRNVRSDMLDETVIVRCAHVSCKHSAELRDARLNFKTCRNCYTYYCSHHCRKDDKERHRRLCLHGRSRQVCKQALHYARENEESIGHLSKVAREGLLRQGKGYVRITLPNAKSGLKFIRRGITKLEIPPVYLSISELTPGELGDEVCSMLTTLSESYDTLTKFILLVTMFVNKEVNVAGVPHWERNVIAKCAKLRLAKQELVTEDEVVRRPRSRRGSAGSLISRKSWRWSLA